MLVDRSRLEKIQDSEGLSKRIGRHGTDGRGHSQKLVCAQQKAQGFPEACLRPAEGQGVPRGLSAPSRRPAGAATPSEDTKTGSLAITVKSETNPLRSRTFSLSVTC